MTSWDWLSKLLKETKALCLLIDCGGAAVIDMDAKHNDEDCVIGRPTERENQGKAHEGG